MMFSATLTGLRAAIAAVVYPEGRDERRRLERAAETDALTGLANRHAFDKARPAAEADPATAILIFDLNNFGKVNKLYDQSTGDACLQNAAENLRASAGKYAERVFRLGGDEFIIICPADRAESVRLRAELWAAVYADLHVTISGTIGATLAAAESQLQARKAIAKL